MLQQYLPLAVLKLRILCRHLRHSTPVVATVLTACGIETELLHQLPLLPIPRLQQYLPLAVLKLSQLMNCFCNMIIVATVLTACGIETGS